MSKSDHEDLESNKEWTEVIEPQTRLLDIRLKEVWNYRDLLSMFVKRDFIATYKQTILGPLWFFIQPVLTTVMFMVVFGGIAGISTGPIPQAVFYLSGITLWNYFSECLNKTSTIFRDSAGIFGKVYFPRLIMPLSIVVSGLIRLAIQLLLFLVVWGYFMFKGSAMNPNLYIVATPFCIVIIAMLSLGLGMIFSSLTTKYRDLVQLLSFAITLGMYATPIIYPLSKLQESNSKYLWILKANPMTSIIEIFRYGFTGSGIFSIASILYSVVFTFIVLAIGIIVFNKVEKSFMDTV